MALSSRVKNKLNNDITTPFGMIGMKVPRNDDNRASYAWEYYVSCMLASMANKRKSNAESDAIKAGVLFDKDKYPRSAGTRETVYNDGTVMVTVDVRNPAEYVDADDMIKRLIDAGVKESVVFAAKQAATKLRRPAHAFTAYLVTEDTNGK